MNKIIIADTSCLIALDNIGHLYILQDLFSIVQITKQVQTEFGSNLPDWFNVHHIKTLPSLKNVLDAGEASALTLALQVKNSVVIIDERKGRKIARELNIEIIGTLKVLLLAKQKNIIPAIKPIIDKFNQNGFRFNKALVEELLKLAKEA